MPPRGTEQDDDAVDDDADVTDEDFSRRVDRYKAQGRQSGAAMMRLANPGVPVYHGGNLGDQPWDLAEDRYFQRMPRAQVERMQSGHHAVLLEDGAIGLKLDGDSLDDSAALDRAALKFRRLLLERCRAAPGRRGIAIVTFDIDDTLLKDAGEESADQPMEPIAPVVRILHDIIKYPRLRDLARKWGSRAAMPDHRVSPLIVTARPYSLEDMEACVADLARAGVRLPRSQCLFMRPREADEIDDDD